MECKEIWSENCIDSYEDKVMEFVLQLHEKINSSYDQNKNVQKIKMAVRHNQIACLFIMFPRKLKFDSSVAQNQKKETPASVVFC